MPQTARPIADITIGDWTDEADGTVDIYQSIDEITPNDADFIKSEQIDVRDSTELDHVESSIYVTQLADTLTDPGSLDGLELKLRVNKDFINGNAIVPIVELRENYVSEFELGRLIASRELSPVSDLFSEVSVLPTASELAEIESLSNLFIRVRFRADVADPP